jgi:hypothetical protein
MNIVRPLSAAAILAVSAPALAGDPIFIRSDVSDLWGLNGQVNAMNDVYGKGLWQDLRFETSKPTGVFSDGNDCIMMEGGNDQAEELAAYIAANKDLIEGWVKAGGRLIINSAPNEGGDFDMGFGVTLHNGEQEPNSIAADPSHPVYDGPFGKAGANLTGDWWSHATVSGDGLSPIKPNPGTGNYYLAEKDWGAGHVIVGGETLDFFYEHPLWTQPDCQIYLKNLISYNCRAGSSCYADLNGDSVLDLFDFLEFTNLFNAGDETANCDGQGGLDLFDFLCYTNEFNAGC